MKKSLFIIIPILFASCSQAPNCDDDQVKELAMSVVIKQLKYEIAYNKYYDDNIKKVAESPIASEFFGMLSPGTGLSSQEMIEKSESIAKKDIQAIINGAKDVTPKYQSCIFYADSIYSSLELYINNIRVDRTDYEANSCDCSATVLDSSMMDILEIADIKYNAQYSVDKILNVNVDIKFTE